MIRTVFCVLILVICGTQGKVILSIDDLSVSNNFIQKVDKQVDEFVNLTRHKLKEIADISHTEVATDPKSIDEDESKTNKTKLDCNDTKANTINLDEEEIDQCEDNIKIDNGTALILTPLIENGKIDEARASSKVNSDLFLGFDSYSGYLTVDKTYYSNLFFWYFPIQNESVNENPWIIWLQGGPGASSLIGLFDEIGPFRVNNQNKLVKNPFTWLKNHSLVFIDNPVGTGYSFTNHTDGYAHDMATYSGHLYTALQQLLQVFPELRSAPLYIAGESYAGKYVPALAMEIHRRKGVPGQYVNLQGLILGNAYTDPEMISRMYKPIYYNGILNSEQMKELQPTIDVFQTNIKDYNSVAAKSAFTTLVGKILTLTHQKHGYNFLKDDLSIGKFAHYLKSSEVKKAIHVGDIKWDLINTIVNTYMAPDFLSSTKGLLEQLLEHYRVLAYCGQLDQMLPCVYESEHYRTWKWNGSREFLEAKRHTFPTDFKVEGYYKTGGRLTEAMIRGAGHMVAMDTPLTIKNLVTKWTHHKALRVHSKTNAKNHQSNTSLVEKVSKDQMYMYL